MKTPTARQLAVLDKLDDFNRREWPPPTALELAAYRRDRDDLDNTRTRLVVCARHGWVERVGVGDNGARTWRLTDAGRKVLRETRHRLAEERRAEERRQHWQAVPGWVHVASTDRKLRAQRRPDGTVEGINTAGQPFTAHPGSWAAQAFVPDQT